MDYLQLLQTRFTAKSYDKDKKVSEDELMKIIEAGRLSPSSFGFEPWKFVHLKDKDILEKIRPYTWGGQHVIDEGSHLILLLARTKEDLIPPTKYLDDLHLKTFNFSDELLERRYNTFTNFIKNDFKLLDYDHSLYEWSARQTYIALSNMLNMAHYLNIDSTPIEGFEIEKVHQILVDEQVYDQDHFKIAVMLGLGYANKPGREKIRRDISEVFEVK